LRRRQRIAFALALVISGLAHASVLPLHLPSAFEVKEVEGEAAIPVDVLKVADAPSSPAETAPPSPVEPQTPAGVPPSAPPEERVQGRGEPVDASAPFEGGLHADSGGAIVDSGSKAHPDAGPLAGIESGGEGDAGGELDGGFAGGPRDPRAVVGAAGAVQADKVLVMLVVNAEVIRTNPVGATLGALLRAAPQWSDFLHDVEVDPVADVDWLMISGPSLINSGRDVVLVHYSAPDAVVDRAVTFLARRTGHSGAFDAGVPGVRATLAHADRADRVILRPAPHVAAVVPPTVASKVARQLALSRVPAHVLPGQALYLRLLDPHHPFPEIPESLSELRLKVAPRTDGGAEASVEADAADPQAAARAAEDLTRAVRRHNDVFVSLLTHGLLDRVEIHAEGATVVAHLVASRDQLETLAVLAGGFLGVEVPFAASAREGGASPP
jgi:hypothetical protein